MIKCNITAIGVITRSAVVRQSREGQPFLSFLMTVEIPDTSGNVKMELSVTLGGKEEDLIHYIAGTRVAVAGVMIPRKRDNVVYYNLKAVSVTHQCPQADSITGDVQFRGTVGENIQCHNDKNGKPYFSFSAFSSDRQDAGYSYVWLRFIQFGSAPAEWMQPKCGIDAAGDMEVSSYQGKIDIMCRVRSLSEWKKNDNVNTNGN